MTYHLLKFVHFLGLTLMGAGLIDRKYPFATIAIEKLTFGLRGHRASRDPYLYTSLMPGQPLNSAGVNDGRLSEMIKLRRRTCTSSRATRPRLRYRVVRNADALDRR